MVSKGDELELWRQAIEAEIQKTAFALYTEGSLHEACRYALESPGKRVRPLLSLASAFVCGADWQAAFPAAMALEWIHTYSLVHDDLPCMDDDDLRRGRPTTHKAFDEATALLVGDALLSDAFFLLANATHYAPQQKVAMISLLARYAGGRGMVYGQALDLSWTGRQGYTRTDLDAVHKHKTGGLIEAACLLGGWAVQASSVQLAQLQIFGSRLGLAFQIIDDLLDDEPHIGKTPGKDQALGKLTYLSVMSASEAKAMAARLTEEALAALQFFTDRRQALLDIAAQLLQRKF